MNKYRSVGVGGDKVLLERSSIDILKIESSFVLPHVVCLFNCLGYERAFIKSHYVVSFLWFKEARMYEVDDRYGILFAVPDMASRMSKEYATLVRNVLNWVDGFGTPTQIELYNDGVNIQFNDPLMIAAANLLVTP